MEISYAMRLIGRPFCIQGRVVRGRGIGRKIGFPTANLRLDTEVLPPDGVYKVQVNIEGRQYQGLANIGIPPVFVHEPKRHRDRKRAVEVHILAFKRDIYQETIEVEFIEKIREERDFSCIEDLAKQIREDIRYLQNHR